MRLDRATRVRNVCGLFIGIVQHTFASGRAHGRVVCLDRATRVRNVKCVWTVHRDCATHICRVGQNHIYMVYIRYFGQGNHQIYGHIRYIYTFWPTLHICRRQSSWQGGCPLTPQTLWSCCPLRLKMRRWVKK
jgi:hypothetical protein